MGFRVRKNQKHGRAKRSNQPKEEREDESINQGGNGPQPKSRIRRTRLRQGKPLQAGNFFRRRRSRRNIYGPYLSNAYRRSAAGAKAGSIRNFRSAILTGQDRRPPGCLHGKLSADSWLGKDIRGPCSGKFLERVSRPAALGLRLPDR